MALRLDETRVNRLKRAWEACKVFISTSITDMESSMSGKEDALVELRSFKEQVNNFLREWNKGIRGEEAEAQFGNIIKIPDFILKGTGEKEKALYKALIAIDLELDPKNKGKERLLPSSSKQPKQARKSKALSEAKPKASESKSKVAEKQTTQSQKDEEIVQHLIKLFSNYSAAIVKDDNKDDKLHAIDKLWRLVTAYNVSSYNVSGSSERVAAVINFIKNEFKMPKILADDSRVEAIALRDALLKIQPKLVYVQTETKQEYEKRTEVEKHRDADFAVLGEICFGSDHPFRITNNLLDKTSRQAGDNIVKLKSHNITINRIIEFCLEYPNEAYKFLEKNKSQYGLNLRRELCKPENEGLLVLLIVLGDAEIHKAIEDSKLLFSKHLSQKAAARLQDLFEAVKKSKEENGKDEFKYAKKDFLSLMNSDKRGYDHLLQMLSIMNSPYIKSMMAYHHSIVTYSFNSEGIKRYVINNPEKILDMIRGYSLDNERSLAFINLLKDDETRKLIVKEINSLEDIEKDKMVRDLIHHAIFITTSRYDIDQEPYISRVRPIIGLIQELAPTREQFIAAAFHGIKKDNKTENISSKTLIKHFQDLLELADKATMNFESPETKRLIESYFKFSGEQWKKLFDNRFDSEAFLKELIIMTSKYAVDELRKLGVSSQTPDELIEKELSEIESASKKEKKPKPKSLEEMSEKEFDEFLDATRSEQSKSASSSKSEDESKEEESKEEKSESDDAASEAEEEVASVKSPLPAMSTAEIAPLPEDADLKMLDDLCNKSKDKPLSLTQKNVEMIAHINNDKLVQYIKLRPEQAWKIFHGIAGTSIIPDLNLRKRLCENPHLIRDLIVKGGPIVRKAIVDEDLLSSHYLHRYQQHNVLQPILTLIEKGTVRSEFCQEQPMQAIRLSAELQHGSTALRNLLKELNNDSQIAGMIKTLQKEAGKPVKTTKTTSQIDLVEFMQTAIRDDHMLDKLLFAMLENHEQFFTTPESKKFRDAAVVHLFVGAMMLSEKQQADQLQKLVDLQRSMYIPPSDWLNYMHHVSTPKDKRDATSLITALRAEQCKGILKDLIDAMISKEYPDLKQIALFNALAKLNRTEADDFIAYCSRFPAIKDLIIDSDNVAPKVKKIAVGVASQVKSQKLKAETLTMEVPVIVKPEQKKPAKSAKNIKSSRRVLQEFYLIHNSMMHNQPQRGKFLDK